MIDVFKVFYPTHYNFAAIAILLLLLFIYLLTKKNFKWGIITMVLLLALNIAIYKRTEGRAASQEIDFLCKEELDNYRRKG